MACSRSPGRPVWVPAIGVIGIVAVVAGVRGWQSYRVQARSDSTRSELGQLLAALQEPEAEQAYFQGWIGNAELMEGFGAE